MSRTVALFVLLGIILFASDECPAQAIPLRQVSPAIATSAELFGLILGVRKLGDGRVIVDDVGKRRLLMLDSALKCIAVIADSAADKGVISYGTVASPIARWKGDSTLFLDRGSRAFVVLDGNGHDSRLAALPKAADLLCLAGSKTLVDPNGNLVYRGAPIGNPSRDTGQAIVVGRLPDSASVVRAHFET